MPKMFIKIWLYARQFIYS